MNNIRCINDDIVDQLARDHGEQVNSIIVKAQFAISQATDKRIFSAWLWLIEMRRSQTQWNFEQTSKL